MFYIGLFMIGVRALVMDHCMGSLNLSVSTMQAVDVKSVKITLEGG